MTVKERVIKELGWDPWNEEECLLAVKKDPYSLQYVRNQTHDICIEAIKQDAFAIQHVKNQTYMICLEAVKNNGYALEYVNNEFLTEELCLEAVKNNGYALQFVKKQTEELCLLAVKQNGIILQYVYNQTYNICMEAVKNDGFALHFVKDEFLTEELCLEAVRQKGINLRFVKNQTRNICLEAVKQDERTLIFVDEKFHYLFEENKKEEIVHKIGEKNNDDKSFATVKADNECKRIIREILNHGSKDINPRPKYADGAPAHTYSINHVLQRFDLSKGEFPLLSLRPIAVKSAIGEILWIWQDMSNDLDVLKEKYGVTWWDAWAVGGSRNIGSCYGATVKNHDLINKLLKGIIEDPDGRRHILSLWQVDDFDSPHGLKPCACWSQFNIRHEKDGDYMDMFMNLRSSDYLTAGCINQVQYIALFMMVARHCGYKLGVFTNFITNCQIYDRHVENAKIMLERESILANPYLELNPEKTNFFSFTIDDFKIKDYPREEIKAVNPQLTFELGI